MAKSAPAQAGKLILFCLAIKLLVIDFGGISYQIITNETLGWRGYLEVWNRWDALHYLQLAQEGYRSAVSQIDWIISFFPLYPWLIRIASWVLQDYLVSAFVVSGLTSLIAAVLLFRLTRLDQPPQQAFQAVWFLHIFPTSYFLHIGYTESLFLALVLGSFLAARKNQWWLAGGLGALASLTRINGIALIPALFLEARAASSTSKSKWVAAFMPLIGFAIYLWLNQHVTGNPFSFLMHQESKFHHEWTWPWVGIANHWQAMTWRGASEDFMIATAEIVAVLASFIVGLISLRRLRASYAIWCLANLILWTSNSFILSVPRYALTLFPIYILLAGMKEGIWTRLITIGALLYMALSITQFVQGRWAF